MPEQRTLKLARKAKREGKSPSTQAGEFVREEIRHIREGKHGARSAKQAIAIGLSKARRAGVRLAPPSRGRVPERTRRQAKRDLAKGQVHTRKNVSRRRSRASLHALQRQSTRAASSAALARQARLSSRRRRAADRSAAARRAAQTRANPHPRARSIGG